MLSARMQRGVGNVFVADYADDHGGASTYGVEEGLVRQRPLGVVVAVLCAMAAKITVGPCKGAVACNSGARTYLEAALSGSVYEGGTSTGDNDVVYHRMQRPR